MSTADTPIPKPDYWEAAVAHLMRRDRILKNHPAAPGRLADLARHAVRDAGARHHRAAGVDQGGRRRLGQVHRSRWQRPTPVAVLRVGIDGLRRAGLSQRKAEYVLDLAAHFGERRVHPERWADMDDEAVISELVAIRGIGRWTAEMF